MSASTQQPAPPLANGQQPRKTLSPAQRKTQQKKAAATRAAKKAAGLTPPAPVSTITPTPQRKAAMNQRALTRAASDARKIGGAPPQLMASLHDTLPAAGLTEPQAVTFIEATWANLKQSYGLKGSITITHTPAA